MYRRNSQCAVLKVEQRRHEKSIHQILGTNDYSIENNDNLIVSAWIYIVKLDMYQSSFMIIYQVVVMMHLLLQICQERFLDQVLSAPFTVVQKSRDLIYKTTFS